MSCEPLAVIVPEQVTDAILIDSNVPESSYPAWNSATAYVVGDRAHEAHVVYQAAANNTNVAPSTDTAGTTWKRVGATNRWAVFDSSVSSQTSNPSLITYQFQFTARIAWVHALNLTGATSIRVQVANGSNIVYDRTQDIRMLPQSAGWWQWFFGKRFGRSDAQFDDVTIYPGATLTVEIEGDTDLAVGELIFGAPEFFSLGVRLGASVGIQDYSRNERTEFGDPIFVRRNFARRANFTMIAREHEVDAINSFMARQRAVPCLWVGSNKYDATTVFGTAKNYDLLLEYPEYSVFNLELEGVA